MCYNHISVQIDKLRKRETRLDNFLAGTRADNLRDKKISILIFSPFEHKMSLLALGALSIYHEINSCAQDYAWADRGFFYDFLFNKKGHLKKMFKNVEMISFEQKIPIKDFDIIAYGMTCPGAIKDFAKFTELAGIPLLRRNRTKMHPLIIGGGPGFANPEPYGDLIDVFITSERAENSVCKILKIIANHPEKSKEKLLLDLSRIEGVYVPDAYLHKYLDGRLRAIDRISKDNGVLKPIYPISIKEYPHRFSSRIIGYKTGVLITNQGCRFRCAFCQLGTQSLRNQSFKSITKVIDEMFDNGIRTLIINSPSFTQFDRRNDLLDYIRDKINKRRRCSFQLYVGSVRIDELDSDYLKRLSSFSNINHTYLKYTNDHQNSFIAIGPEFGTNRLMRLMRKGLTCNKVLEGIKKAKNAGFINFHCYFILGIESETNKDRIAIVNLLRKMVDIAGKKSRFYLKINLFIPTVGTVGQRMQMRSIKDYAKFIRVIELAIEQSFTREERERINIIILGEERLLLEALLMRGGRNVRPVLTEILTKHKEAPITDEEIRIMCGNNGMDFDNLLAGFPVEDTLPWKYASGVLVKEDDERLFLSNFRKKSCI